MSADNGMLDTVTVYAKFEVISNHRGGPLWRQAAMISNSSTRVVRAIALFDACLASILIDEAQSFFALIG
jgi:hypothetical protein